MPHRPRLLTTLLAASIAAASIGIQAQTAHVAPPDAPSTARVAPPREPGTPLSVSGVIVGPDAAPIPGASMYVYQTDAEGYYGVKPESDSSRPRLKAFLRSDASGRVVLRDGSPRLVSEQPCAGAHPLRGDGNRIRSTVLRDRVRRGSVHHRRHAAQPRLLGPAGRAGRPGHRAHRAEPIVCQAPTQPANGRPRDFEQEIRRPGVFWVLRMIS